MPFMQQMTGINAVVTSARTIVAKILPSLATDISLILNCVQLLGAILSVLVLSKVGRKPLTLFGNAGFLILDLVLGILFVFHEWAPSGIIVFVLLTMYMFLYGISLGPVVWLYVP